MVMTASRGPLTRLKSMNDVRLAIDKTPSLIDHVVITTGLQRHPTLTRHFSIRRAIAELHPSTPRDATATKPMPRLLDHVDSLRRVIFQLVADGKVTPNGPYDKQGNLAFYTDDNVAHRLALRHDPTLCRLTRLFWNTVVLAPATTMDVDGYTQLFLRIHKFLIELFNIDDSTVKIEEDWTRDTNGENSGLDYEMFHLSLFELIDLWCDSLDAKDYVHLLFAILDGISVMEKGTIALKRLKHIHFTDLARVVSKVTTPVVCMYLDAFDIAHPEVTAETTRAIPEPKRKAPSPVKSKAPRSKERSSHNHRRHPEKVALAPRPGLSPTKHREHHRNTSKDVRVAKSNQLPAVAATPSDDGAEIVVDPTPRPKTSPAPIRRDPKVVYSDDAPPLTALAAGAHPLTARDARAKAASMLAAPFLDITGRGAPISAGKTSPRRSTMTVEPGKALVHTPGDRSDGIPPIKSAAATGFGDGESYLVRLQRSRTKPTIFRSAMSGKHGGLTRLKSIQDIRLALDESPSLVDNMVRAAGLEQHPGPAKQFSMRRALAELQRETSSRRLLPTALPSPPKPMPRLLDHVDSLRRVIFQLVADGKVTPNGPYDKQGNLAFYTDDNVAHRLALRHDPTLCRLTRLFWNTVVLAPATTMDVDGYTQLFLRIHKFLIELFNIDDSTVKIQEDWARDTNGESSGLDYEMFHLSLFELIDLWCDSVDATDYIHLLYAILDSISFVENGAIHLKRLKQILYSDVAKAVQKVSTAVVHMYLDAYDLAHPPTTSEKDAGSPRKPAHAKHGKGSTRRRHHPKPGDARRYRQEPSLHKSQNSAQTTAFATDQKRPVAVDSATQTGQLPSAAQTSAVDAASGLASEAAKAAAEPSQRPTTSHGRHIVDPRSVVYIDPRTQTALTPAASLDTSSRPQTAKDTTSKGTFAVVQTHPFLDITGRCAPLSPSKPALRRHTMMPNGGGSPAKPSSPPVGMPPLNGALAQLTSTEGSDLDWVRRSQARAAQERRHLHGESPKRASYFYSSSSPRGHH
ncbi:hypothetical protein ACHHYP_15129 [Achlya hypogyna]|uniref:Uncharacterized protein n=1 Tax=Achlya hypogyna TaxID=1202772 RepID=A0A1V9ZF12_ACHHY|nr:hypothetical protein ACHHYP_15129 [Achlya hypogyna]